MNYFGEPSPVGSHFDFLTQNSCKQKNTEVRRCRSVSAVSCYLLVLSISSEINWIKKFKSTMFKKIWNNVVFQKLLRLNGCVKET